MARPAVAVGAVIAVLAVGAGSYVAWHEGVGPLPDPEGCTATAGGHTASLSIDQAGNASIIAAVAERRGLPARAISIAIAAAIQESKLQNLEGGDRDSIGIFQQRPSQGWGTPRQLNDPYYATNAFYDALVTVDGYENMPITEAAQAVQRSAYPDAYAEHESDGRAVASALSGYSPAAFTCVVHASDPAGEKMGPSGLTGRADAVRRDVEKAFGTLPMGGFAPGGVTTGHMAGSAHYDGRAIDIVFRPVSDENQIRGWAVAQYLVANARRLDVEHVIFDGRIWTAGSKSEDGWRRYVPPKDEPGDRSVLEHRDHVHVDVF
ncbi:MAG TPA: hypothetical protein VLK34_05915 [Nocardioidaceae bacterium]|nr:hypothetical protein [Nocardioidaceae bacterium]